MDRIKRDIKDNSFAPVYLIYGTDDYMKKLYTKKLKNAVLGDGDLMNCNEFYDVNMDENEIISVAQTLPFFSERRVIIITSSKFFKNSSILPDYFETFAPSTVIIFCEDEVDKRSKMYKLVKKLGYVCEMNGLSEDNILKFIYSRFAQTNISITESTVRYIMDKVGTDMNMLTNECEKLISFVLNREDNVVTNADVDQICTITLENRIFEMIDDLAFGRRDAAIKKYMDLLSLKEAPLGILALIRRHYNILLILSKGRRRRLSDEDLSKYAKIPSFTLKKYKSQLGKYSEEKLLDIVNKCVEYEESFKSGNLSDQMAVELLLCTI